MTAVGAEVVSPPPASRSLVLRRQLGVSSAQWLAGLGNLAFVFVAARFLDPHDFADMGAFLGAYALLHLPGAGIGAGAARSVGDLDRARRRLLGAGVLAGVILATASGPLAAVFSVPRSLVLVLAAAAPSAALLGLERGARFNARQHRSVAAGLIAEPLARLSLGAAIAPGLGAWGGAVAVTMSGYLSLWATRRGGGGALATAPAPRSTLGASTAVTFGLLALMQQQDLLVAKVRLDAEGAAAFTALSTAGGAVAFATTTVPLVVLPSRDRSPHDAAVAMAMTVLIGVGAVVVALVAGAPLIAALFGDDYRAAAPLLPLYAAAMGALGAARVLAARSSTRGEHRRVGAAAGVLVVVHLALLAVVPATPTGIAAATFAATSIAVGVLLVPAGQIGAIRSPARASLAGVRAWAGRRDLILIATLTAMAAGIRVVAFRGLWVDEAISVAQAQLPFGEMMGRLREADVHPPLHHAVLWVSVRVLGTAEWVVRLPSVLAGAVLVPVVNGLGRALYDRRTGLAAAGLVALAPFLVWYSQEARMYSVFVLAATSALWAQVEILRGRGRWAWAAYVLATTAMVWCQWFAVVQVAAQQVVFLVAGVRRRHDPSRPRLLRPWMVAALVVVVCCAPLVPVGADQLAAYSARRGGTEAVIAASTQAGSAASALTQDLSVYAVAANLIWAVAGYHSDEVMMQIAAAWPLCLLAGFVALGRGRSPATSAVLFCVALPLTVFVAAGSLKRDLFELRYFSPVVPLLMILAARAVTAVFRRRLAQGVAFAVAGGLLVVALVDQQLNGANPRRYDFESALAVVEAGVEPGDVILYAPDYLAEVVAYYGPDIEAVPLAARSELDPAVGVWVVATTRVADEARVSATVGSALADLEQSGRSPVSERRFPNVRLWELR